jgi:hypothetical protein
MVVSLTILDEKESRVLRMKLKKMMIKLTVLKIYKMDSYFEG